ncbi:hypothetical protein [Pedobacter agri]|uniref:hypothetical protein n=1 Tax=Pedobacter agri TaxID=454586 RepID=UPI00292D6484|nr:hypothetical protein [Pedobacter agri]
MKSKLYTLSLIFCFLLISCKKDAQVDPVVNDPEALKVKITGNWITTAGKIEYYDASGKLAKTEDQPVLSGQVWEFAGDNSAKSVDARGTRTYNYSFYNNNNINYISITNNPTETYKITIDNNKMTWSTEGPYNNDPAYTSAKLTYYFVIK